MQVGTTMAKKHKKPPVLDTALSKVLAGGVPDVGRDPTLGTIKIVDPYEEQEWHDGRAGRPAPRTKVRSLKHDPLGTLHQADHINEAQYMAGRRWQEYYYHAEIGTLKGIDTTKEAVDGGRFPEVLTDRQRKAVKQLHRMDMALGAAGASLVREILGERLSLEEIAKRRGMAGSYIKRYFGQRFRECLETLAREMELA